MATSTLSVMATAKTKSLLTPEQKTFNRLKNKIQDLQLKQESALQDLDASLQLYGEKIAPTQAILLNVLTDRIKIAYQFYKTPKGMRKDELKLFKQWIAQEAEQICQMNDHSKISAEIKEIFKEFNGFSYEEIAAKDLEYEKNKMKEFFKAAGIDIDLSHIDINDSQEDMMRNVFRSIGHAVQEKKEASQETQKEKKLNAKELKRQALEEMQAKGLSAIYTQLVKVLHPDLEQNKELRERKEEFMKKLTCAYEKKDLYGLLSIQIEWMDSSNGLTQIQSKEQLKVYNSILKDQIDELENTISMLIMHPKYVSIQRFFTGNFYGKSVLEMHYKSLNQEIQEIQAEIKRLEKPGNELEVFSDLIDDMHLMNIVTTARNAFL
jgi:hypothetical protein